MREKVPTNSTLLFMWFLVAIVPGIAAQEISPDRQQDQPKEKTARPVRLRMSKAVICSSIDGYERFKVLPGAAQTADEKLLVYYRPLYYKTVQKGDFYLAHFTQEGRIRRRGEKTVLLSKKNLLDYEAKSHEPLGPIFLRNHVSLKGLPPGEYEYDIILRDENEPGPPSMQSVKFRVIAAVQPLTSKDSP